MSKKSILQKILAYFARATIRKYKPIVVGITGSAGKTSTREAVFAVLKKKYGVRTAEKNYNNEIGLPLAILGSPHYGRNVFQWLSALVRVIFKMSALVRYEYPQILVLEYGVDRPGDMDYLLTIAKPNIAVVTAIGDVPAHVEFFKNPEALVEEKAKLVASLPVEGYAVLNHDDYAVFDMKEKTKANIMTFGQEKDADVKISNFQFLISRDEKFGDVPRGINFKIEQGGDVVPVRLHNTFGLPQAYSAAAAATVGLVLNLNLVEVSQALEGYVPPPGRLRLVKGVKNSFILDDTYNASPESMRAALETLRELPGKRKIAILGDMLEIGKYSEQAHRAIGDRAAKFVDLLFCIGPRAKFIADAVHTSGRASSRSESGREAIKILKFDDSVSAGNALDPMIREGDLILVKGSQAMRMEKIIKEIMAEPERAGELLVRQEGSWQKSQL